MTSDIITPEACKDLLNLARMSIHSRLENRDKYIKTGRDTRYLEKISGRHRGTFVTLFKNGQLRGCVGNIEPVKTIEQGVQDNARHAAFNDTRFSPLSAEELDDIRIEVSVLTPMKQIAYSTVDELLSLLRPGIDGVMIQKGHQSATFLPQVWAQLSDRETFLTELCLKAGLSATAWQSGTLEVSIYQVQSFEEEQER